MRICVLGATGRTGRKVVAELRASGHEVVAITRGPVPPDERGIHWVAGSVLDAAVVDRAVAGTDAVIVALGPTSGSPRDLCGRATAEVVESCRRHGVVRLVVLTGAMIGLPATKLDAMLRTIRAMWRGLRPREAADRARQEELVRTSGLAWTLVRPPRLTDGPATAGVVAEDLAVTQASSAARGTVARVLVDAATSDRWAGQAVVVVDPA